MNTPQPDFDPLKLENQLCFPLYAAARRVVGLYTPYLKPLGLTYTQYLTLLALWEYGDQSVGDICRLLRLDSGTLTPVLKHLSADGLIRRQRDPADERVVRVSLTPEGWALRERAVEIPEQIGACLPLDPQDAMTLYRLLYRLLAAEDACSEEQARKEAASS